MIRRFSLMFLLIMAINLIAYAGLTPGTQAWASISGGICVGIFVGMLDQRD